MRKALAFLLVSSLLFIPLAAFADNAGIVGTELIFSKVVNLSMYANWPDGPITQPMIDTFFNSTGFINIWDETVHGVHDGEIFVTIQSLGKFHVYASYWTDQGAKIGDTANFLGLNDVTPTGGMGNTSGTIPLKLKAVTALDALGLLGPPGNTTDIGDFVTTEYSDLGWAGSNNMGQPALQDNVYDVLWTPSLLTGDFKAGDTLDLKVYILVDDPAT